MAALDNSWGGKRESRNNLSICPWHHSSPCLQVLHAGFGNWTESCAIVSMADLGWEARDTWMGWKMWHHLVASGKSAENTWRAGTRMPRRSEEKGNWYLIQKVFISFCKHMPSDHTLLDVRLCEHTLCIAEDFLLIRLISPLDVADGISANKDWCLEDIIRWMKRHVVLTCRGKNVRNACKYNSSLLWLLSWE